MIFFFELKIGRGLLISNTYKVYALFSFVVLVILLKLGG